MYIRSAMSTNEKDAHTRYITMYATTYVLHFYDCIQYNLRDVRTHSGPRAHAMARPQRGRAFSAKPRSARAERAANLRCSTALGRCVARRKSSSPRTKPARNNARPTQRATRASKFVLHTMENKQNEVYVQDVG